ncbi:fimbria/pilus outer membrane usher protein [Entomohabitans teleogrylli]|uniref:fimbria/pilus outer membrane usher protein n=1 Tax=Entomohabitans teleogrylli TaxID=1384589 RepID=UPI0013799AD7|nr:fimbria/pilus outer membrane usher protein [Entomohabitans teleogrylli]
MKRYSFVILPALLNLNASGPAHAIEFATGILNMDDKDNINLRKFEQAGYISPGNYRMAVLLNKQFIKDEVDILFITSQHDNRVQPCLSRELVDMLGIKEEVLKTIPVYHGCLLIDDVDTISTATRMARSELMITIPQALLRYHDPDWVPPARWDEGIAGLLLDYDIAASNAHYRHGASNRDISSYGTAGVNVGAWRVRGNYQYAQNRSAGTTTQRFDWTQRYAFRAIPELGAKLQAGQIYLNSSIFDAFRFNGLSLSSDERMLAPSLRGYAPQVSGIARTNARVRITQNGRTLYETSVPPGPFVISDLNQAVQGLLDVSVEEEDGSTHTFQVSTASIPFLTRQGFTRFKLFAGKPTYGMSNHTRGPEFFSGEVSRGVFNNTSLYGGLITAGQQYQAATLGLGQDMHTFGALSADVTRSRARRENESASSGHSYRFNYAKQFAATGSQLSFAGYRFSDRQYISLNDYLDNSRRPERSWRERETWTLMGNQPIPVLDVYTYLSYTHRSYWYGQHSSSMTLSANRNFSLLDWRNITGSLSISRSRYQNSSDNQVYLGISIPVGPGQQVSYDGQYGSDGHSHTASYFNAAGRDRNWRISAGGSESDLSSGNALVRGNYRQRTQWGTFSASASQKNNSYRAANIDWTGSLTITRQGAALSENLNGETPRIMISADGEKDVGFNNGGTRTNRFGIAVIPGGSSYENSAWSVDVRHLPEDVEARRSVFQSTLTEGAIGYQHLALNKGHQAMAAITLPDGSAPGFGSAVVDNETGKELGIVGNDGQVYLTGIRANATAHIELENGATCTVRIPDFAQGAFPTLLLPCEK